MFPLENRTGDETLDHLGLLAADKLSEGLVRVGGGVRTIPTGTADLALRNEPEGTPVQEITAGPGASVAISGYYTTQGDNLVFRAEAVNVATGERMAAIETPSGNASTPRFSSTHFSSGSWWPQC